MRAGSARSGISCLVESRPDPPALSWLRWACVRKSPVRRRTRSRPDTGGRRSRVDPVAERRPGRAAAVSSSKRDVASLRPRFRDHHGSPPGCRAAGGIERAFRRRQCPPDTPDHSGKSSAGSARIRTPSSVSSSTSSRSMCPGAGRPYVVEVSVQTLAYRDLVGRRAVPARSPRRSVGKDSAWRRHQWSKSSRSSRALDANCRSVCEHRVARGAVGLLGPEHRVRPESLIASSTDHSSEMRRRDHGPGGHASKAGEHCQPVECPVRSAGSSRV